MALRKKFGSLFNAFLLILSLSGNIFLISCDDRKSTSDRASDASKSSAPDPSKANQAPTITLIGEKQMTWELGQEFVDPGATAVDPEDGDISSRIRVVGTVNFNQVSDYYGVTYEVTDSAGLAADSVTRFVHVRDTTAPNTSLTVPTDGSRLRGQMMVFEGLCEPDQALEIWGSWNGAAWARYYFYSPYCNDNGTFLFNNTYYGGLSEGIHRLQVRQTDAFGNTGLSNEVEITVDNSAPNLEVTLTSRRGWTIAPRIPQYSQYGLDYDDYVWAVNYRDLVFNVTCDAGASIEVSDHTVPNSVVPLNDYICPSSNTLNLIVTLTDADGVKSFSITSRDEVGNLVTRNFFAFLDRIPPELEVQNGDRARYGWRGPSNFNEFSGDISYQRNELVVISSEHAQVRIQSSLSSYERIRETFSWGYPYNYRLHPPAACASGREYCDGSSYLDPRAFMGILLEDLRSGEFDGPGYFVVTLTDDALNETSQIIPVTFDFTTPTIQLVGEAEVTVSDFWEFYYSQDPGAIAMDDELGDISGDIHRYFITPNGNPPFRLVYYTSDDGWGNSSSVVRRVNIAP